MKQEIFKLYLNDHFVETGTFMGDGVNAALKYGFKKIHSVELGEGLYKDCVEKFKANGNVTIYLGDSAEILGDIIEKIDGRITFWLDGHYHPFGSQRIDNVKSHKWGKSELGDGWTPILKELDAIKEHRVKNHTIMIDDMREFKTSDYGSIGVEGLKEVILSINPRYKFNFHDVTWKSGQVKDDIMVAYVD
jgi:phage FluMu gp28-like protein